MKTGIEYADKSWIECERTKCKRKAMYIIQVIGYDIHVCRYHRLISPITTFWANIRIKIELWKYDKIHWSLWTDVFPTPRMELPKELEGF